MATLEFPTEHPPLRFEGADDDPKIRRIVEAAYDLLDEEGLEGLTIRAVLARSGLARRAFYERFTGKDDLVLAVFEQTIRLASDYYRRRAVSLGSPLERLAMIVTSIGLRTASLDSGKEGDAPDVGDRRSAALSREHLRLADTRPQDLQTALAPLIDLIAETLRDGIAAGQVRECDPEFQARLIYNLVSTTVHTAVLAEEGDPADPARRLQFASDIWEFCRRAVIA